MEYILYPCGFFTCIQDKYRRASAWSLGRVRARAKLFCIQLFLQDFIKIKEAILVEMNKLVVTAVTSLINRR